MYNANDDENLPKLAVVVMMWAVSAETIYIRGAKRYAETSLALHHR